MFKFIYILTVFFILNSQEGFSQSIQRYAIASAAGANPGSPSIQSNIGELISNLYAPGGSSVLTQGFIQNDLLSLSIKDLGSKPVLSRVFPNPVSSGLVVELSLNEVADIRVEVYDLLGKKQLIESNCSASEGTSYCFLDFKGLNTGTYFVRIISDKNNLNQVVKITKI